MVPKMSVIMRFQCILQINAFLGIILIAAKRGQQQVLFTSTGLTKSDEYSDVLALYTSSPSFKIEFAEEFSTNESKSRCKSEIFNPIWTRERYRERSCLEASEVGVRWGSDEGQMEKWGQMRVRWRSGGQMRVRWRSRGQMRVRWRSGGQMRVRWRSGGQMRVRWRSGGQMRVRWRSGVSEPLLPHQFKHCKATILFLNWPH